MSKKATPTSSKSPSRSAWWLTLPLLTVTLVVFTAADGAADAVPCRAIDIEVDQLDGMYFVDAPSLRNEVIQQFALLERPMESLPYAQLHEAILDHHGVSSCEIVPTLGGSLQIRVQQQRPIARVWTPDSVLYLDDEGRWMPLSDRYTAQVPIVHAPDRESARDAMPLLRTMDRDAFWNGFIDQVAVEDDGNVRFHPRIGDLVVELGNAEELDDRLDDQLRHLKTFYRALLDSGDLRQYGTLDLRYDGQLVASK